MLNYTQPLGRLVRAPFRLIPPTTVMRVLSGPARGLRWEKGAYTNGCWLGTYERHFAQRFANAIAPGMTVYDVGAHTGYYTVMAAKLVGPGGRVAAFEPIARNLSRARTQVALNQFRGRVRLFGYAIGNECGKRVTLVSHGNDETWRVETDANPTAESAPMTTLDALVSDGTIAPPNVIKMDIEGAEGDALEGAERTLARHRPQLFIALHREDVTARVLALLRRVGYHDITRMPGVPGDDLIAR